MGFFDDAFSGGIGSFLGGLGLGPIGNVVGGIAGYGKGLGGPGVTGQPAAMAPPDLGQFIGGGTYQEATITNVNKYVNDLKNQLGSGKITQDEYLSKVGTVIPQAEAYIKKLYSSGGKVVHAAQVAGSEDLLKLGKEMNVYKSAKELLGRDITPQEFAQFLPKFSDSPETGRAYLSEFAQQEAKSPQALAKKAPQYAGQVGGFYQDLLKRGATAEEADYFGRLMATGQVTPYEIQEFIKATPEYQTGQDVEFRKGLEGELAGYDEKAFGRERENILSQYTKAGLQNSSALDFAITDALGKVQEQRGQYLAGLSSQQYGGNKAAARGDYEYQRNLQQSNSDYGRNKSDAYLDYLTQRADQGSDYTRQKNDYLQFLAMQPKQKGPGALDYITAGAGLMGGTGQLMQGFGYLK